MAPVAKLISRAAVRYLGVAGRTIGGELVREAARRDRDRDRAGKPAALPPPPAPAGLRALAVYVAWLGGLGAFALVLLNLDIFLPDEAATVFRLAIGAVLLLLGIGLLVERLVARRLLLARLTARWQGPRRGLRRAGVHRLVGAGLTLLGIVWVATGVLEVLRGLLALG